MAQLNLLDEPWYSEAELAERLKVKPATLQNWRTRGLGPRYFHIGNKVNYSPKHVNEWLQTQVETPCNSFPAPESPRVDRVNKKHVTRAEKRALLQRETRGVH